MIHVGRYVIRCSNPDAQFDALVISDKLVKVGLQLSSREVLSGACECEELVQRGTADALAYHNAVLIHIGVPVGVANVGPSIVTQKQVRVGDVAQQDHLLPLAGTELQRLGFGVEVNDLDHVVCIGWVVGMDFVVLFSGVFFLLWEL